MTDYIASPPAEKVISVTRGCDRSFTLQRVDTNGDPVSFGSTTVYMWIDVDKASPTKVDATVNGAIAGFHLQSALLDQVKNSTRWRAVWDQGDLEIPLLVGKFERHDG